MPTDTEPDPQSLILLDFDDRGDAGRVARVTFNNPEKRNRMSVAAKQRLIAVLAGLRHDESVRAVVITGAGDKAFVAGTDISEMADFDLDQAEAAATLTHRMCDAVRTCPVPVVARINGYCLGSGMELCAAADIRIAADHAKFGMPEVRHGIPSGMEASLLPRLVGWGNACELVLLGDIIDAEAAHGMGYLNRLVPYAELDASVEGVLASILAGAPRAMRIQKRLNLDWDRMSPTDGARAGIQAYVDAYRSDEPRRYMSAFMAKRRP